MMFLSFSQPRGRDGIVKGWLLYVGQDTGLVITTLPTYLHVCYPSLLTAACCTMYC